MGCVDMHVYITCDDIYISLARAVVWGYKLEANSMLFRSLPIRIQIELRKMADRTALLKALVKDKG